ncbi:hypothetical protein FF1_028561 [Malus domestica]
MRPSWYCTLPKPWLMFQWSRPLPQQPDGNFEKDESVKNEASSEKTRSEVDNTRKSHEPRVALWLQNEYMGGVLKPHLGRRISISGSNSSTAPGLNGMDQ